MTPAPRVLTTPVIFLLAVLAAVGIFMTIVTKVPTTAIALVGMTAAVIWAFRSEQGGIYCLILAALFEGLYKAFSPNMLTMLVKDIFLVILLIKLFWYSQRHRDFTWLHQPFSMAAACFTVYCVALMFAPTTRSTLLAIAGLRAWVLWMPAYFPLYHYFSSPERVLRFTRTLMLIMLPVSLYGIVQGNIGYAHTRVLPNFYNLARFYQSDYDPTADPNAERLAPADADDSKPIMNVRACSIHVSPASFGAMCAALVLLSVGYAGYTSSSSARLWAIVSGLAAAGGLLASGSRGPMMALVVGLIAMLLVARRKTALVTGAVIIVLVSVFLLRDLTGGGALRLEKKTSLPIVIQRGMLPLERGLEEGLKHPFGLGVATGVGIGRIFYESNLPTASGNKWVESEFGRALMELGLVGTTLWLAMIVGILWHCVKAVRFLGDSREGLLAAGLFGAMVTVFAQLSVGSALYGVHPGLYYWVFAAIIVRMAQYKVAAVRERRTREKLALAPTGSLGAEPPAFRWRQPGQPLHLPRPGAPGPVSPGEPGGYRRAPGAPVGPRPGAPLDDREPPATPRG